MLKWIAVDFWQDSAILERMNKSLKHKQLPIIVEKDEDGLFVVECPALEGCYSQGKTLDEALKNIHEAIELALEEKKNRELYEEYAPREFSFHLMSI